MADLYHMTPRCGPLKITQEGVVEVVRSIIEIEGLEAARAFFEHMNKYFSTERGWAETAMEVRDLFAEVSRMERKRQVELELARIRAAAPNIFQLLPAAQSGVIQLDNHSVNMSGDNSNYTENNK